MSLIDYSLRDLGNIATEKFNEVAPVVKSAVKKTLLEAGSKLNKLADKLEDKKVTRPRHRAV